MEETKKEGKRRGPYLPLPIRIQLYEKVLQLREQELSYSKIIERIHRYSGVRLSPAHIGFWVNGKHQPLGKVNTFDAKPSQELCYVIGAVLSDGNRYLHGYNYHISLKVNDYEYAYEFSQCLAKVLARKEPYSIRWRERCWTVEAVSILLYQFLDRPWKELKPYIEHCKQCVAAFLKAFFDGEAGITKRDLNVYNTNFELLRYMQYLLGRYFDIETTGPRESAKPGYRFRDPRNDKIYVTKKQCYCLHICARSLARFVRYIGFTIRRKQQRLLEATQKIPLFSSFFPLFMGFCPLFFLSTL